MTGALRRGIVVGSAGIGLLAVVLISRDDVPEAAAARRPIRSADRTAASAKEVPLAALRLERLREPPTDLEDVERNLFRFATRPAPAPPPSPAPPRERAAPSGSVPATSGPPAPPAIPLRYIGLLDAPAQAGRVAVLSDGRGNIFYGREGDTIEGRYLLVQVGPASAEVSYLDGRGRQTIRLSGQ